MVLPKFIPPHLSKLSNGMPLWLTNRNAIIALSVFAVAVLFLLIKLAFTGKPSTEIADDHAVPLTVAPPAYQFTYPAQVFKGKSAPRAMVYTSSPDGIAATTFKALNVDDVSRVMAIRNSTTEVTALNQRQYLAEHGYSWTPEGFMESARKGDLPAMRAYIIAGMDAKTRNSFSSTALHAASEANQLDAAKLLLAAGADVDVATTTLQTPLHRAVANGFPAMTQLLITAGARTDAATLEGWTPLFYAVDTNNQKLAEFLLASGATPNMADKFGNTPLILAIRKNYVTMAKRLIQLGAKANMTDLTGRTALHYAVSNGYYQGAKILLDNGAKAEIRDRNGVIPMDIALANQDLSIANLLLANGARRSNALGKPEGATPTIDPNRLGQGKLIKPSLQDVIPPQKGSHTP